MSARTGRVLIVGDNDLAGLASVRSLGRAGHEVELVAFEPGSVTRRSRYVRRAHDLGHPAADPAAFARRVVELTAGGGYDLVLPTSDKALVPLMPRRAELAALTRFAAPDEAGFALTYHKDQTMELARRAGVPIPPTQVLRGEADLAGWRRPAEFPVVLKPSCSVLPGTKKRNEVAIVRSAAQLEATLPGMLRLCPVLVQGFCRGRGVGLTVLAGEVDGRPGELIAAFQHERVHEPPEGGASSYRRSAPLTPELLEAARRCSRLMRWTGPAMFEFKVDPDTGAAALMEINGRLWGSLALAIHAGVDFPRLLYDLLVRGAAAPTFEYKVPCYVRHTTRDVYWLRQNFRAPAGRRDLLRLSAARVLSEVGNVALGRERYDLESLSDPAPAVAAWAGLVGEVAAGLGRRLSHALHRRRALRQCQRLAAGRPELLARLRRARSVLFVCAGNVNRSAVAQQRLRELLGEREVRVESGGLLQRPGRPTGETSLRAAAEVGVDLSGHLSDGLTAQRLREADLIVAMEVAHLPALARLDRSAPGRTFLLGAFHPDEPVLEIADPEGLGEEFFLATYRTIVSCVEGLARRLGAGREAAVPVA